MFKENKRTWFYLLHITSMSDFVQECGLIQKKMCKHRKVSSVCTNQEDESRVWIDVTHEKTCKLVEGCKPKTSGIQLRSLEGSDSQRKH